MTWFHFFFHLVCLSGAKRELKIVQRVFFVVNFRYFVIVGLYGHLESNRTTEISHRVSKGWESKSKFPVAAMKIHVATYAQLLIRWAFSIDRSEVPMEEVGKCVLKPRAGSGWIIYSLPGWNTFPGVDLIQACQVFHSHNPGLSQQTGLQDPLPEEHRFPILPPNCLERIWFLVEHWLVCKN